MDKVRILAFALCLAFAGCTSPDASENGTDDNGSDQTPGNQAEDGGRSTDSPALDPGTQDLGRLTLTDCFHLLGFVPMDWASAEALLPAGFTPITWTVDEDPTDSLAILEVLFVDCQSASLDGVDLGPSASLWLQPDVEASDAKLLVQNNFHAYSAHSNPEVQAYWSNHGPAEAGVFSVAADVPEKASLVTLDAPSLQGTIHFRETGAIAGKVTSTWRVFYANDVGVSYLDMAEKEVRGTFPGSLDLALATAPFPIVSGLPAGATTGFGNGHGGLQELRFDGPDQ